jgi:D-glycero-alpha-D-manno-heptose-7-phosphate kinase
MIFRSKAPLRIGLAGGGTDVSPFCDLHGGAILNATISLYAHASIELTEGEMVELVAADRGEKEIWPLGQPLPINGHLDLHKGCYNHILQKFGFTERGMRITTFVEAPAGSGLGTSSTLMVALVGVFAEMLKLPLGEYDLAKLAYEIERNDLQLAGGKQDQYAATFGGVNFMEFYDNNKVIVNPLRIKSEYLFELENNLVLYFTNTSRRSEMIIREQQKNVLENNKSSLDAMHSLKEQAVQMKEALLQGNLGQIGEILNFGFNQKRKMAANISNPFIEKIYAAAMEAGATGGKISGAGGGGFMFFYCPGTSRYHVIESIVALGGQVHPFNFTKQGMRSWASSL